MDTEQSQQFYARLNQWVAGQGFWFQVRHSVSGGGMGRNVVFQLVRMMAVVGVCAGIGALGAGLYLSKRVESKAFGAKLRGDLKSGLVASEMELGGFSRSDGELVMTRLVCEGGEKTFYNAMDVRNVRCKMGFLDGFVGQWDTGTVVADRLEMDLRAGTDDAASARMLGEALFPKLPRTMAGSMEVADVTLRWGYSLQTRGSIENSLMKAQRGDSLLKLTFKGGKFSQNWLRDLEIVNLVAVCTPDGITFEAAEFRRGATTVDFTGLKLAGGELPTVKGLAKVRQLSLKSVLVGGAAEFVDGVISGDFEVSGSTNSSAGVCFSGKVKLEMPEDEGLRKRKLNPELITLEESLPLMKALSVVDYVRTYRQVNFREGEFQLKTSSGGVEISDIKLQSEEISAAERKMERMVLVEGKLSSRLPNAEEMARYLEIQTIEEQAARAKLEEEMEGVDKANAKVEQKKEAQDSVTVRVVKNLEKSAKDALTLGRRADQQRYSGELQLSVMADTFTAAPMLAKKYPVDEATGRRRITVPLAGSIYELTAELAEEFYRDGKQ